jgi:tetratricopeptide (TPR) repeat protein
MSRPAALLPALLLLLVLLTFGRSLGGGFIWDDRVLVERNQRIRDPGQLGRAFTRRFWDVSLQTSEERSQQAHVYYRPLVTASFSLDYGLYGMRPWGYHLTNLLLHLGVVGLALALCRRLLGRGAPALVAALLFAVHPSRAEAVSWISGRSDLLMALLALGALLLFWRALRGARIRGGALAGAWLLYAGALLSKETAVGLAVVVPCLDLLWSPGEGAGQPADAERRRRLRRNALVCHLPLALVTAGVVLLRLLLPGTAVDWGLGGRLAMLLQSLGHYLELTLLPYDPSMLVGSLYNPRAPDWGLVLAGAGGLLAWGAALALALKRQSRVAAIALVLLAAFLAPVSNLVPLGLHALVAERFLYLPLLGLALLLGLGLRRLQPRRGAYRLALAGVGVLAVSWAVTASLRSADFAGEERFWRAEVAARPDDPLPRERLAAALLERARPQPAERWMRSALAAAGQVGTAPGQRVELQLKLLDVRLMNISAGDEAGLRAVLAQLDGLLSPPRPPPAAMRRALRRKRHLLLSLRGNVYSQLGQDRRALEDLGRAHAAAPDHALIAMNLALARVRALDLAGARRLYRQVQALAPDTAQVRSLGRMLGAAAPLVRRVQSLPPSGGTGRASADGLWLTAQLYKVTGARHRAVSQLRRLVRLHPRDRQAWAALATELASGGDPEGALEVVAGARRVFGSEPGLARLERRIRASFAAPAPENPPASAAGGRRRP